MKSQDAGNPMWALSLDSYCGSSPNGLVGDIFRPAPEPTQEDTYSAEPTPTEESPTPVTYTPTARDPKQYIGQVLFSASDAITICGSLFESTDGSVTQGEVTALLPRGRALLNCTFSDGTGANGGTSTGTVLVNLVSGEILWSQRDSVDPLVTEQLFPGTRHFFFVTTTTHPAEGLNAEYVTRQIAAWDATTGEQVWSKPLDETVPREERGYDVGTAIESDARAGGADGVLYVEGARRNGFDASTGKKLWTASELNGTYVGSGISLDSSWDGTWTAYSVRTGKPIWSKKLPENATSPSDGRLIGGTFWMIGNNGVLAFDLATGRLALNLLYPDSWQDKLVTPDVAIARDATRIGLYRTTDLRKALWSVKADDTTFLAVSEDLAVVQAPSGILALDGATGEIRNDITIPDVSNWTPVDGLVKTSTGDIFELSPPSPA